MFNFVSKAALKARIKDLEEACRLKEATIKNLKGQAEGHSKSTECIRAALQSIRDDTKNPMKTRSRARLSLEG